MNTDPALLSAAELRQLYRTRQLSPVETTRAVLERIERLDPQVNAFCLVDEERALAAARAAEARWHRGEPCGVIDGVPATIKDLVLTRDWPTLRGSLAIEPEQPWDEDAPATARLRAQGAVLIGKTTTPEFGWKAVTDCALTGITRNPWDTDKTPGGSSGGAAVAAALGMGVLHVGTDGGGSIRIPAGFTGVFGLKPSFGRVPAYPASPFGTVAHLGPLTRTVGDAAVMLNVLALPDSRDWFALPYDGRDYLIGLEDGVRGLRIAFSPTLGFADVEPEIADLVAGAVGVFVELGASVEQVDVVMDDPLEVFAPHWYVGRRQPAAHLHGGAAGADGPGPAGDRGRGRRDHALGLSHRGAATHRARRGDAPLSRELRPAAHADPAARGVRGGPGTTPAGAPAALVQLGAVLQSIQPDPAAGGLRALRPHRRRPASGPADRRADARGCFGPARGTGVRSGATMAPAGGAAGAGGQLNGAR